MMASQPFGQLRSSDEESASAWEASILADGPSPGIARAGLEDVQWVSPRDREQLARDLAEIERATQALRRGQPELETWSGPPAKTIAGGPRSIWLLVGVLWVSTALLTVGAAVAIAALVG